jgi:hypothetical protein
VKSRIVGTVKSLEHGEVPYAKALGLKTYHAASDQSNEEGIHLAWTSWTMSIKMMIVIKYLYNPRAGESWPLLPHVFRKDDAARPDEHPVILFYVLCTEKAMQLQLVRSTQREHTKH